MLTIRAIWLMLFASLNFSIMALCVKLMYPHIGFIQSVFFRNVFGLFFLLFSFIQRPIRSSIEFSWTFLLLLFRGFIGTLALFTFFYNLGNISLGESTTYIHLSPFFVAIFSWLFFKETLRLSSWLAIGIGFLGIIFIVEPFQENRPFSINYVGITCGLFTAIAYTSIKELNKHYETRLIVLSFTVFGTFIPLLLYFVSRLTSVYNVFLEDFQMPEGVEWFYIFMVGLTSLLGQLALTKAYSLTKAGVVSTVGYSNVVFSFILGFWAGDSLPGVYQWLGVILIVLGGILISWEK